jgi:hypothetical protein
LGAPAQITLPIWNLAWAEKSPRPKPGANFGATLESYLLSILLGLTETWGKPSGRKRILTGSVLPAAFQWERMRFCTLARSAVLGSVLVTPSASPSTIAESSGSFSLVSSLTNFWSRFAFRPRGVETRSSILITVANFAFPAGALPRPDDYKLSGDRRNHNVVAGKSGKKSGRLCFGSQAAITFLIWDPQRADIIPKCIPNWPMGFPNYAAAPPAPPPPPPTPPTPPPPPPPPAQITFLIWKAIWT